MSSLGLFTCVSGSGTDPRPLEHAVIDGVRNPECISSTPQRAVEVRSRGCYAEVGRLDGARLELAEELAVHSRKGDIVVRSVVDREVAGDR